MLGSRPEGLERIIRRVFRWDSRLLLGIARALGRPVFRFLVVEADGKVVATTMLTFAQRSGYVSMVSVDTPYRRRGIARQLLEEARRATAKRPRPFVVLDVLEQNAPARALYESIGYRRLRAATLFSLDAPAGLEGPATSRSEIRAFRRPDAPRIAEIARRGLPPTVLEVLPPHRREYLGSAMANRLMEVETAAWVIDRGEGPEGWVGAGISPAMEAAHLSNPVLAETVEPELGTALVRTASRWLAARHPRRILTTSPEENVRGRRALTEVGYRDALSLLTLYRPAA